MSETKISDIQLHFTVLFINIKTESVFRKELRAPKEYNNFSLLAHVCKSHCQSVSITLQNCITVKPH